jgi:hypothetical protein
MKMSQPVPSDPVTSLLQKLTSRQIGDLIVENRLNEEGYHFFYTVDNHDIHKYCFPGNIDGNDFEKDEVTNRINYDLENDKATAYDEFFCNISDEGPVFFLSEYITELSDFKASIEQRILSRIPLYNYSQRFLDYFNSIESSQINLIEDITLFISIATGFVKNGTQRLNDLLLNPNFVRSKDQLLALPSNRSFSLIYDDSNVHDSDLVDEVFSKFMIVSPHGNRFSKRTDSEAIARVLSINNKLIDEYSNDKGLLLYLSTTDVTKRVFNILSSILPNVNGYQFNFHRTVEQLFIKRLLQDLPHEQRLERLQKIQELIEFKENTNREQADDQFELEKSVVVSLKELRGRYVNTNLARRDQFEAIESLNRELEKVKVNMNFNRLKILFNNIKEFARKYKNGDVNISDLQVVETAFSIEQTFIAVFKKAIFVLKEKNHSIRVSRGNDKITGTGQHLPIVFRYLDGEQKCPFDEIAELYLDQFAFLKKDGENESCQNRIELATRLTTSLYEKDFSSHSMGDKLSFCLYLLILPLVTVDNKTNTEHAEKFLRDLYKIYSAIPQDIIYSDLLYSLAWVSRRNKKYTDAECFTNEGISKFPDDARFYHSRFLIRACHLYEEMTQEIALEEYRKILEDVNKAKENYTSIIKEKSHTIQVNILATLLNSEIYTYALCAKNLLDENGKMDMLYKAQEKLVELKSIMGSDYETYPEFLHTEAVVKFSMALYQPEQDLKRSSLLNALSILDKAIEQGSLLANYNVHSYRALKNIMEVQIQNIKSSNYTISG